MDPAGIESKCGTLLHQPRYGCSDLFHNIIKRRIGCQRIIHDSHRHFIGDQSRGGKGVPLFRTYAPIPAKAPQKHGSPGACPIKINRMPAFWIINQIGLVGEGGACMVAHRE